jgi:FKBP-type peptidyl-prolyl cis-trans isomerase FklB
MDTQYIPFLLKGKALTPKKTLKWMVALGVCFLGAHLSAQETPLLKTEREKVSYVVGVDMARNFQQQGLEVDLDLVLRGMKDVLSGEKLLMTEDEFRATMSAFRTQMRRQADLRRKQTQKPSAVAVENKKTGDVFLAENKTKEGIMSLPSGLQYKILRAGEGKKPAETDTVECHYTGTLINGTEFDSSYRSGQPVTFKITTVIPGWREALKLMPVGSKWQLFIPPGLAYGARGSGQIPPNSTLIFEVELLAVK